MVSILQFHWRQGTVVQFLTILSIICSVTAAPISPIYPHLKQKFDNEKTPGTTYPVKICFEGYTYEGYQVWVQHKLKNLTATRKGTHFYQCPEDLNPSHYEILEFILPFVEKQAKGILDYLKGKQAGNPKIKTVELDKDISNVACIVAEELDAKTIEELPRLFRREVRAIYEIEQANKSSIIDPTLQSYITQLPHHPFTISVCFRPESEYVKVREDYEKNLISSRLDDPSQNFGITNPEYLRPSKYTVTEYLKNIIDEDSKNVREFIKSDPKYSSAQILQGKRHEIYARDCIKITGAHKNLILEIENKFPEVKEIRISLLTAND